jgi:predicted nucleic acid-binding protein
MLGLIGLVEVVKKNPKLKLKSEEIPIDEDDTIFVLCAVSVKASYLVSGDPHLLVLRQVRGTRIISPREFFKLITG